MTSRLLNISVTLVFGIVVTLTGIAFTWNQIWQSELDNTALAARQAIRIYEQQLDQASNIARLARPLLLRSCSPDTRKELGRLVIGFNHIQVINLFRLGRMSCSSWQGAWAFSEDATTTNALPLTLLNDSYTSPGVPVMVLRTVFAEGVVSTSMAAHWIAETLQLLSKHTPLILHAGDMTLSGDNQLYSAAKRDKHILGAVKSDRYPFAIEYDGNRDIATARLFREGAVSLFLSIMLGISAATGLWLIVFRSRTPYEQLAVAIEKKEIVLWYQPVIDSRTGIITGVEVLARWVKPDGTVITPDCFIPLAESSKLIIPLTRSLMSQASRELSALLKKTDAGWHIGFNITQAHMLNTGFIDECLMFINAFEPGGVALIVELTEREPFDSSPEMQKTLRRLHENGILVALDDFGTGYANLEYISEINIDLIKIDRAFVRRIGNGKQAEQLLSSLIDMVSALELRMIAEGVETDEQAEWLNARDVSWHQGYLYSLPVSLQNLEKWIRK